MKNSNGEGSTYFDNKRNCYVHQFSYFDKLENKTCRKKCYGKTVREAKKKKKEFLDKKEAEYKEALGNAVDLKQKPEFNISPTSLTSEWLDYWLETIKKPSIQLKTYEKYEGFIRNNINPFIGDTPLNKVSIAQVQQLLVSLLTSGGERRKGLAPRTVNATRMMLKTAFSDAVNFDLLQKNPVLATKAMSMNPTTINILTPDEAKKLISVALKSGYFPWITLILALETGMRIGEIFGLQWSNIDLENRKLKVDKTVVTTRHGDIIKDSGKNKFSKRSIPLAPHTVESLKQYRKWQLEASIMLGAEYSKSDWVLSNANGSPYSPNYFSSHMFKDLLKEAGIIRNVRFHDLRHTHATWLLEKGVNVKVVSERLGHASIRITLDTYSHVLKTMQEKAVEAIEEIF